MCYTEAPLSITLISANLEALKSSLTASLEREGDGGREGGREGRESVSFAAMFARN